MKQLQLELQLLAAANDRAGLIDPEDDSIPLDDNRK
jgi:hypothetical protein